MATNTERANIGRREPATNAIREEP